MASKKASGFLGGAGAGASMGSVAGPYGAAIGGVIGGVAGLMGSGGDEDEMILDQFRQGRQYIDQSKPSQLGFDYYTPEDYQAQQIADDPEIMAQQKEHLRNLSQLADSGLSETDAGALDQAMSEAGRQARASREAALTSARARGVGGGGLEFTLGEQGTQDSLERARRAAFDKAAQTAQQRALYQTAYGDALGKTRDQNFGNNAANTDIINQFNQLNTASRNDAQLGNITRKADTQQLNNANKLGWAQSMAGQSGNMANALAAQQSANQSNFNANVGLAANAGMGLAAQNNLDNYRTEYLKKIGKGG